MGKGWGRETIVGLVAINGLLSSGIGCDGLVGRIDEPAHVAAMLEAVEDVVDNLGAALVGGEDFNGPVGGEFEAVGDVTTGVRWDVAELEDGDVGDDRSASECAA